MDNLHSLYGYVALYAFFGGNVMDKLSEIYSVKPDENGNRKKITRAEHILQLVYNGDIEDALIEIVSYLSEKELENDMQETYDSKRMQKK